MAFQINPSSINMASMRLAVIGNNIANSSTSGFKSSQFDDALATSMAGSSGSKAVGTQQNFSQGEITATSNPLDMAISGNGFFRVTSNGVTAYTRNGQFSVNKDGAIVNSTGDQLTGFGVDEKGQILPGLPVPLSISAADYLPIATDSAKLKLTLDAGKTPIPSTTIFNASDPSTYTHSTATSVFAASGTQIDVQTFYVKRSPTAWDVFASVGGTMLPANQGQLGSLTFDASGALINTTLPAIPPAAAAKTASLGVFGVPVVAGAKSVNFDMSNTVQFGTDFSATMNQDGSPPGHMVGYRMAGDGIITASYSNGQAVKMGQVVLASFKSMDGLALSSSSHWLETTNSGPASLNTAGAGGLGTLNASATENANVDLTSEMIKMISAQRVFQAAAQMVKKQDEVMQTVVNIGQ